MENTEIMEDKVPLEHKLYCVNCNLHFKNAHERNKHIKEVHEQTYEQYIMKNYFNDIYPTCACGCGTKMTFSGTPFGNWFAKYTTNHWERNPHTEETKQKIKENTEKALVEKFGVKNIMLLKEYRDKIKQTKQEHYGNENYNNIEKGRCTKLEKYGNENYNNIEKIKETNQIKYNANWHHETKEGRQKIKDSFISRYGVDNPMKDKNIKNKLFDSNIKKYGYKSILEDPLYRKKYNINKSKIEKIICDILNGEYHFIYENKIYDIKLGNNIIEIDGDYYHPGKIDHLCLTQLNSMLNDYNKEQLIINSEYKLFRIKTSNIPTNININTIINNSYVPNYSLQYNTIIIDKNYLEKYLYKKGEKKLKQYVPLLLKFLRTFQPEFPYPTSEENLIDIKQDIKNYDILSIYNDKTNTFNNNCSLIGVKYLKSKFKSYWYGKFKNNKTPIDVWNNNKLMHKIIEYRIGLNKYNKFFDFSLSQIFRAITELRIPISFFKPILAASIYYKLLGDKINPIVIDPCAGFGGRLLGFKSKYPEGTYIGIEPNIDTYKELCKLRNEGNFNNVYLYNCKFEDFILPIEFKDYDLIFTSIPYYDTEIYSKQIKYNDFNEWKNKFFNKFYEYNNVYINLPSKLCNELNVQNIKDEYFIKSTVSHFGRNKSKLEKIIKIN